MKIELKENLHISSGFARRCAEKLCFSESDLIYLAAPPPFFNASEIGSIAAGRLFGQVGKAELLRTSSGKAARKMKIEFKEILRVFLRALPVDVRKSYAFPIAVNRPRGSAAVLECFKYREQHQHTT